MGEVEDARRTIAKAEEALENCAEYFAAQAAMNAQAHMSQRVMYPPIHAAIMSVLTGIQQFRDTYDETEIIAGGPGT